MLPKLSDDIHDGTLSPDGQSRSIRMDEPLSREYRDWYWDRVREIVRDVFHGDADAVDSWQAEIYAAEATRAQTLFYHADPLHTAADVCKAPGDPLSPDEEQRYRLLWGEERTG
jgi:hypothetical protein